MHAFAPTPEARLLADDVSGTFNGDLPKVADGGKTKALEVRDYT